MPVKEKQARDRPEKILLGSKGKYSKKTTGYSSKTLPNHFLLEK